MLRVFYRSRVTATPLMRGVRPLSVTRPLRLAQAYDDRAEIEKIMKKYEVQFEIANSLQERRRLSAELDKELADLKSQSRAAAASSATSGAACDASMSTRRSRRYGSKKKKGLFKIAIGGLLLGVLFAKFVPAYNCYDKFALGTLPSDPVATEKYIHNLEQELHNLPIVKKLYADPRYLSFRAWENLEANSLKETMVNSTLATPGGFAIEPLIFLDPVSKESVTILHVGRKLCGYPMLVHGGILATILDENLKRCSLAAFKERFPRDTSKMSFRDERSYAKLHTQNLTLQYKFPTLANSFIVIKAKCVDNLPADTVKVEGTITTTKGRPLVKGDATLKMDLKTPVAGESRGWFWSRK